MVRNVSRTRRARLSCPIRRSGPSPEATRQRLIEYYFLLLNHHHHDNDHPGTDDCRSRCSDDCQAACGVWIWIWLCAGPAAAGSRYSHGPDLNEDHDVDQQDNDIDQQDTDVVTSTRTTTSTRTRALGHAGLLLRAAEDDMLRATMPSTTATTTVAVDNDNDSNVEEEEKEVEMRRRRGMMRRGHVEVAGASLMLRLDLLEPKPFLVTITLW
ncbi:hypothetical protein BDZ89DRAFT_1113156 [Hymenopellis radicata]|nr:hypothetical protein BDZ89DRAFT_1113156 [Hymenopellis radicata]